MKIRQVRAELFHVDRQTDMTKVISLDFKLSPCSECCIISFGWFPSVWILCADVSEHSVQFSVDTTCEDGTECFETSAHKIQTPGNRPKERIQANNLSSKFWEQA